MDPLKPFSSSIRSLWEQAAKRADAGASRSASQKLSRDAGEPPALAGIASTKPIQSRLQSRLTALKSWDASRARAVFVATVVLNELGEALGTDPAFEALVRRVSEQLGADSALSARLDELLKQTRDGTAPA